MTVVDLRVIGVPAPQGSKTRMPNGAMVEGGSAAGRAKHRALWDRSVDAVDRVVRQFLARWQT